METVESQKCLFSQGFPVTTLFMVAINTMIGVLGVEPDKRFAALCLGATRRQVFLPTRSPITPGPAPNAGTISFIGAITTMPAEDRERVFVGPDLVTQLERGLKPKVHVVRVPAR